MIKKRNTLSKSEVKRLSGKICSKILELPETKQAESVGIYISFKNEVLAEMLLAPLFAKGKKIFVPVVSPNTPIRFAHLLPKAKTRCGLKGTREPIKKSFAKEGEINVFVVPGLAFDLDGFRIGWGKGHYDQFFSRNKKAIKIGAAYDFQIVRKIDAEAHDVKMDLIVTEKRVLNF
jgi:5-formyltetrahydrofolate cyclo-ligase